MVTEETAKNAAHDALIPVIDDGKLSRPFLFEKARVRAPSELLLCVVLLCEGCRWGDLELFFHSYVSAAPDDPSLSYEYSRPPAHHLHLSRVFFLIFGWLYQIFFKSPKQSRTNRKPSHPKTFLRLLRFAVTRNQEKKEKADVVRAHHTRTDDIREPRDRKTNNVRDRWSSFRRECAQEHTTRPNPRTATRAQTQRWRRWWWWQG